MKNLKNISLCFILILVSACASAQVSYTDSLKTQLNKLLVSKDASDHQMLNEHLRSLAASSKEIDMSLAVSYYYQVKNMRASDSVLKAEIQKFPKGLEARLKTQQAITGIKSLPEMEKAYGMFLKSFPPDNHAKLPFGEDRLPYDRVRITLAIGYAKERNLGKANYYADLLEADFWKVKAYSDLSAVFYGNDDLVNAAIYQKKAIESAAPFAGGKLGNNASANFAAARYPQECGTYARILCEQKHYTEALPYIEIAVKAAKTPKPEFNYTYAEILAALNRNQEAYEQMETVVKSGEATQEMADLFKVLYVKVKGSEAGLDVYQADIRKGVVDNLRKRLAKDMINKPAVNFTLADLDGKKVTLADLKGKVVILDFWATWCVPCKASFPAMQAAQNKFKDDPNVKFLFIHTWERTPTAVADAKAYINSMKYNFEVLMDTKDPETKTNKVVDSFNVNSIPTKFVIDGKGNIRFRLTGFDGSNEAAVDEISMMIAMIKGDSE